MFPRSIPAAVIAAAAVFSLAACSPTDSRGPEDQTLTIGFDNEPPALDPAISSRISSDRSILNAFFDTLLRYDQSGEFRPALAESWETDDSTVTFTLRDDVTFHDGTEFNAEAVVVNLERILDPETQSTKAEALSSVDSVEALDERTVQLNINSVDPLLLINLAHEAGMMASPAALEDSEAFALAPVGTGPFVFERWQPGIQLDLVANDDYWRVDAEGNEMPYLDGLEYRFLTDPGVLRTELATGGIDLVRVLPPNEFEQLADSDEVTVEDVGVHRSYYVSLNTTRPPFDDPAVRRAVSMAVDRNAIGSAVSGEFFELAPSFATEGDWFYDGSLEPAPGDPEAAKQILEDAGLVGTEITIIVRNRQPDPLLAELLQAQLGEAGFTVQISPLELEAQLEQMRNKEFDAAILVIDVPRLDPSLTFDPYLVGGAQNNWSGVDDPRINELLTAAKQTVDQEERAKAYIEVQRIAIEENYYIWTHQPLNPLIHRADVEGLLLDIDGQWNFQETSFAG